MVLEFDQMQGIAGQYYALNDKESSVVATAIREHYLPKSAGDEVPQSLEGCAVALADRLDTLVGIFSIGEKPTGSKDPFALRRAAIGVLNIILTKQLDVSLEGLLERYSASQPIIANEVLIYILERFRAMYQEQGIAVEVFNSVMAKEGLDNPLDIDLRVQAVSAFNKLPEAQALAAANKRVMNILSKSTDVRGGMVNDNLFEQDEEHVLYQLINSKDKLISPLLKQRKYTEALTSLAELRPAVDAFFDKVMVNSTYNDIRSNRFGLLMRLRNLFLSIADISYLVPEKK